MGLKSISLLYNVPMLDEEEAVVITVEEEDWQTRYFKEKGKPTQERTVIIQGHVINIVNYDHEFVFTGTHLKELQEFVTRAKELNPNLLRNFKKIVFGDTQPPSRYNDEEKHPFNGTTLISEDGVWFHKRGQRTDIRHRTGDTSNFQGTLAHEVIHLSENQVEHRWRKDFEWHYCSEFQNEWEQTENKGIWRNKTNGRKALEGQFTKHPERCVTDYGRMTWDDDYADSGVVAVFNPQRLQTICPQKLEVIRQVGKEPEVA